MVFPGRSPWAQFPGWSRALLGYAPAAVVVGAFALSAVHPDAYHWGTGEDGPAEWATVVCYLLALGLALVLARRWWSRGLSLTAVAYLVLSAGFVFIAGEEVSWGQRILGFDGPPDLVERNLQGEANLHNLLGKYALHGLYIVVGIWGVGLGRWVTRRVRALHPWYAYAPSRELLWWFLPVLAYYLFVDYLLPSANALPLPFTLGEGPDRLQEVMELLLGAGFGLFLLEAYLRSGRERTSSPPGDGDRRGTQTRPRVRSSPGAARPRGSDRPRPAARSSRRR